MNHTIVLKAYDFLCVTVKNYVKNDCINRASSLTITSLLEMVPLLVVFFGLLTLLPNFDTLLQPLQDFIFNNFLPDSGQSIQVYILKFTANANHASWVGSVWVLLSSLLFGFTWCGYLRCFVRKLIIHWCVGSAREPKLVVRLLFVSEMSVKLGVEAEWGLNIRGEDVSAPLNLKAVGVNAPLHGLV